MEAEIHLSYSLILLCTKSIIALFRKSFTGVYSPLPPALLRRRLSLHVVETWQPLIRADPDWSHRN